MAGFAKSVRFVISAYQVEQMELLCIQEALLFLPSLPNQ